MLQDRKNYSGPRLCGTTLGSPLVLRTRAETWVFPHNPRPLVFFLSQVPVLAKGNEKECFAYDSCVRQYKLQTNSTDPLVLYVISLGVTRLRLATAPLYHIHHRYYYLGGLSITYTIFTLHFNPFTLREAKRGLTILNIFFYQKHFLKNI